jgi:hypothetical protein
MGKLAETNHSENSLGKEEIHEETIDVRAIVLSVLHSAH